jgi:hypothetical protein
VRHETANNLYKHENEDDKEGPANPPFVGNRGAVAVAVMMVMAAMIGPMLMVAGSVARRLVKI